jgi:DNA-directed RNA polymerase subunit H (RpoH/RPB5)
MSELANVEMNVKEMMTVIITNLGKLFHRRNYIDKPELPQKIYESILADKFYNFEIDGKKLSIDIMNIELKNISSGSNADDYLNKNIEYHKFLIVKSFSKKTYMQIQNDYKNAEIFTIYEMLEDIPAKEFIPEHTILNDTDKAELLESFGLNELGRIYSTDIMARYYGAKTNDVFRIIRSNTSCGTSVYYRLVINGNMDIFS